MLEVCSRVDESVVTALYSIRCHSVLHNIILEQQIFSNDISTIISSVAVFFSVAVVFYLGIRTFIY